MARRKKTRIGKVHFQIRGFTYIFEYFLSHVFYPSLFNLFREVALYCFRWIEGKTEQRRLIELEV